MLFQGYPSQNNFQCGHSSWQLCFHIQALDFWLHPVKKGCQPLWNKFTERL